MKPTRDVLESRLNDLDPARRRAALEGLLEQVACGAIVTPPPGHSVNLHCHTSFSYNGYGYSPTYIAWRARCEGLYAAGLIDFDVLDGVDEFLTACARLGLRGCAGMETRAFVPRFETRVINSPGEPGIAYHIGVGFTASQVEDAAFQAELKAVAQERNRGMLDRLNPFLDPVTLDYERDVLPLTPKGNATERHLCEAFNTKAQAVFADPDARAAYWAEKLSVSAGDVTAILDNAPALQALIRSKTMKTGGAGYVTPNGPDFPALDRYNRFILEAGAIPVYGWLDGTSEGEQAIDELLDVMVAGGVAAVNIIPDRNWNIGDPAVKRTKLDHLYAFADMAGLRGLPIVAGTEMNAHGQRFVDDFAAPELAPLIPAFVEGAQIVYAHTLLQGHAGMGYLSPWATRHFGSATEKNAFFQQVGERADPSNRLVLDGVGVQTDPESILRILGAAPSA